MKPHNGQHEPRYTDEPTVMCSLRYPDLTCHRPTARCDVQEPHLIAECGEWQDDQSDPRLALVLQ